MRVTLARGAARKISILVFVILAILGSRAATPVNAAAPTISNITTNATTVARYDKFEIQFNVTTNATQPDLPFDAAPPPGIAPNIGITVDALFSRDNWATTITQPAFLLQPFTLTVRDNQDHVIPNGAPRWVARFAPQQSGAWQFRLRAQDAGGTTTTIAQAFTVSGVSANAYRQHGFIRVSPTDKRYFEFSDGTPFIGVGFNEGLDQSTNVAQKLQSFEQSKINFLRVWMSGAGINGSQWTSWASHHLPNDAYLPGVNFDTQNTYNGAAVAMRLDTTNPCFFADFWQGGIPVQPDTMYRVTSRVKLIGITGPANAGAYGFIIKQAGWLGTSCDQVNGTPIITPLTGTTGWITVTGTITTSANQYWLGNLYLARQNATGGIVYIDDVRLWREGDSNQVNLLREPNANSHLYFDPLNLAKWDKFIELAEQRGVYLKLVIDEKNEWIRNHINASGAIVATGSNDNFYAAPNTLVRWLHQAWWRHLIARWGYSTAIHSFEFINEGDPYNGNHYDAANAMARYMHTLDPARHLVTTSFWHSFPGSEFWANLNYPDVDYVDLHAYVSTGWGTDASFIDPSFAETRAQYIHSGNGAMHFLSAQNPNTAIVPRGLVIRGAGEWIVRYWMKANAFTASCSFDSTGGMQRVRWMIDGGIYWGGKEGVVPFNNNGQDFLCTSPGGTINWQQFSSDQDRTGALVPTQYRLILADNAPHAISLRVENSNGVSGEAWIDDVELISPSGQVMPVLGAFDLTRLDEDTAWTNYVYGMALGGASPVGAQKPIVRGEGGNDINNTATFDPDLLRDTNAIWLHNNVWAQVNPGGMYDLMWWATETIPPNVYYHYLTYRNFMDGIPLSNGNYRDVRAHTSNVDLRAWGQRDDVNGRIHLWIQNTQHSWKRVINGPAITPVSGSITVPSVAAGNYRVTWWNTYVTTNPVFLTQTLSPTNGAIILTLPNALSDDVAVKIEKTSGASTARVFLPMTTR